MAATPDLVEFLCDRMSLGEVEKFLEQFGGTRVPKRSDALERQRNVRILVSCLLRTVNASTVLTEEAARAVAEEFHTTPGAIKNRWYAWNRTGRQKLDAGASTTDATDVKSFRY